MEELTTDYGEIESTDTSCTRRLDHLERGQRGSWTSSGAPPAACRAGTRLGAAAGRYRLAVTVAIESGSKASGSFPFTVVPDRLISAGRGAPSGRAAADLGGGQLGAVAGAEAWGA